MGYFSGRAVLCAIGLFACLIPALGQDVCLPGKFHKPRPSPEGPEYAECHSWRNRSCCNVNLTLSIKHFKATKLYDYHWDRCGTLSAECEKFIKDEECFYQCEPRLYLFRESEKKKSSIKGVPICASYCDAWFDACKTDQTCVEDWLNHFNYSTGTNHCPTGNKCVTFAQMYKNGEGLCNKMWGHAFIHHKAQDNCMVMKFDPSKPNPNSKVDKLPVSIGTKFHASVTSLTFATLILSTVLLSSNY